MARGPRISGERLYHHIYAWGNNRQAIFVTDQHYKKYLGLLETYSKDYRVDIIAYAFMQSHIHLFVFDLLGKVSQFMNSLHGEYAQYFNHVTGRVGHVFGERFNNKVVQVNMYGLWLSRYIHRQAVEAGLVTDPKDYPWSSYHAYIGQASLGFIKPAVILEQFRNEQEGHGRYKEFVVNSEPGPVEWDEKNVKVIGTKEFRHELEERKLISDNRDLEDKEIVRVITELFDINSQLLIVPRGIEERKLRHRIFRYMVDELDLSAARVARLCDVSPMAVVRALKPKV